MIMIDETSIAQWKMHDQNTNYILTQPMQFYLGTSIIESGKGLHGPSFCVEADDVLHDLGIPLPV